MKKLIDEAHRVIDEEQNAINNLRNRIDDNFLQAVNLISSSRKVIGTGIGKSGLIAHKIAATLSSIGVSAFFLHPVEALHGDIGTVQKDDVVIMLSKSGSTEELIKLLPYLKMRQAIIISILGNTNSYLARNSDIVIDASVEREACPFNLAPTSSTTAALVIGDALALCAMKIRNVSLEDFSKLHPLGQIGRSITLQVKDAMHYGANIPKVDINASAKEILIEISDKKLGCACVLEKDELVGIVTDGDIRRLLQKTENFTGLKAADIMVKSPITVNQEAYLNEAVALMENRESQISVLPVLHDTKLVGVIRIHDIVKSGV